MHFSCRVLLLGCPQTPPNPRRIPNVSKNPALVERNQKIVNYYIDGLSGPELARAFGLSHPMIYKILHDAGVRARTLQAQRDEQIVNDYVSGMKIKAIASAFDVSMSAVHRVVRNSGVERRMSRA